MNEHAPHKDSEDVRILASPRGNVKIPQSTSIMLCKTLDSITKGIYLIYKHILRSFLVRNINCKQTTTIILVNCGMAMLFKVLSV